MEELFDIPTLQEELALRKQLRDEFSPMFPGVTTPIGPAISLDKHGRKQTELLPEDRLRITLTNKTKTREVIINYQNFTEGPQSESVTFDYAHNGVPQQQLGLLINKDGSYALQVQQFRDPVIRINHLFRGKAA